MALEHAHGQRGAVLKQVVGPGEGVRVIGEGRAPHRRAAGGVEHAHGSAAAAGGATGIAIAQVFKRADQAGNALEPVAVDAARATVGAAGLLHQFAHAQSAAGAGGQIVQMADIEPVDQGLTHALTQSVDQAVQALHLGLGPRLHQGLDGGGEQAHHRLFRATQAGPVAAGKRQVDLFFQQDVVEHADGLFEVINAQEIIGRAGQIAPQAPTPAQGVQ